MNFERVDLAVVGAGPAGLAAAVEAARRGLRVAVFDESPEPGGRLRLQTHPQLSHPFAADKKTFDGPAEAQRLTAAATTAGVSIVSGAAVWGVFPGWHLAITPAAATADIPPAVDARAVVLATGAVQNPVVLPGWTLPGVITAGAAQALVNAHRILPGRRAVVIGVDLLGLSAARIMAAAGTEVAGVLLAPNNALNPGPCTPRGAVARLSLYWRAAPNTVTALLALAAGAAPRTAARFFPLQGIDAGGFRLLLRQAGMSISGRQRVEGVAAVSVTADGKPRAGRHLALAADVVVTSGGLAPLVELAQAVDCPLAHVPELGGWVPLYGEQFQTPLPGLFVAGSATGVEGAAVAEAQGRLAGIAAAARLTAGRLPRPEELALARSAIELARRRATPFHPRVAEGRRRMETLWQRHHAAR